MFSSQPQTPPNKTRKTSNKQRRGNMPATSRHPTAYENQNQTEPTNSAPPLNTNHVGRSHKECLLHQKGGGTAPRVNGFLHTGTAPPFEYRPWTCNPQTRVALHAPQAPTLRLVTGGNRSNNGMLGYRKPPPQARAPMTATPIPANKDGNVTPSPSNLYSLHTATPNTSMAPTKRRHQTHTNT